MSEDSKEFESNNRESIVEALEETWGSTLQACQGLDEGKWSLATECPGWSVKDQISHLVGTERFLLGESPPESAGLDPAHVKNLLGAFNERWVDARRGMPGERVLAEFREVTRLRIAELRHFGVERFDEVGPSPIGEVPYRVFMEVRAFDSWVHEQDIRIALGREGGRGGRGEEITLRRVRDSLGYVVGRKVGPPEGTKVSFDVSGPLPLSATVVIRDGRGVVQEGKAADPTAAISLPADVFWRLGCGRISPGDTVLDGDVAVVGDVSIAERILAEMAFAP
ncbi:MAG: maleylpyruvate isomerase N-terminal domain-containing protein [Actinobacteria bacterium]|nr:maleylpyruvate isomerase N-terminal domain-containing protein [Actinomycetota bacterium]MCL5445496.1 maleylpyruvate isomerase N-terminal domain-containing protein [Actinomycetota bacterium]